MSNNIYRDMCETDKANISITIKLEEPEYEATQPRTETNMHYHEADTSTDLNHLKNEIYNDSIMMDFIETSIDSLLVEYTKDKPPKVVEKRPKGAERQRIYRQNETQSQRDHRLEMAREYIKKKRQIENDQERYTRLKKQRERIRSIRDAMKSNPELYEMRKQIEADRMKMRRANETPSQRTRRLEKSRMYSKRRRENQVYRIMENEKNRLAHQYKRTDEAFRLQEQQRDRARKKIKKSILAGTHAEIHKPELVICDEL